MINATKAARVMLSRNLERLPEQDEGVCFRLVRSEDGQFRIVVEKPAAGDVRIDHEDQTVLAVDRDLAPLLDGRTIDRADPEPGRGGLVVR